MAHLLRSFYSFCQTKFEIFDTSLKLLFKIAVKEFIIPSQQHLSLADVVFPTGELFERSRKVFFNVLN